MFNLSTYVCIFHEFFSLFFFNLNYYHAVGYRYIQHYFLCSNFFFFFFFFYQRDRTRSVVAVNSLHSTYLCSRTIESWQNWQWSFLPIPYPRARMCHHASTTSPSVLTSLDALDFISTAVERRFISRTRNAKGPCCNISFVFGWPRAGRRREKTLAVVGSAWNVRVIECSKLNNGKGNRTESVKWAYRRLLHR